tara:strand:+ start:1004 stop:1894 length:891 start_codon:yes stop_codon:yes gene_type:complete
MSEKILEKSTINWYPGHMHKAKKELAKKLKSIDIVLEMRDARIPISSVNHDLEEMLNQKKRILIFNKTGLADDKITKKWNLIFSNYNIPFLFIDSLKKTDLAKILPLARSMMKLKWSTFYSKGIVPPSLKLMIVGIPNVGKSSLINRLSKRKATEIGPNPGVTKHQDWIKLDEKVELLDTPGILWPKIKNYELGLRLSITGAIKDSIVGTTKLSFFLLSILKTSKPKKLERFYKLSLSDMDLAPVDLMKKIAEKRGCLKKGGTIDLPRAESMLLRDFRTGKLGRLSFDIPRKNEFY